MGRHKPISHTTRCSSFRIFCAKVFELDFRLLCEIWRNSSSVSSLRIYEPVIGDNGVVHFDMDFENMEQLSAFVTELDSPEGQAGLKDWYKSLRDSRTRFYAQWSSPPPRTTPAPPAGGVFACPARRNGCMLGVVDFPPRCPLTSLMYSPRVEALRVGGLLCSGLRLAGVVGLRMRQKCESY